MLHSFIPAHRYFAYLNWNQVAEMDDKKNVVMIQPLGAIEQHGPHLPLAVDAVIAMGVLGKALEKTDNSIPAYSLPALYYGKSNEHLSFPGTIAISAATLGNILTELAENLYRNGFRKLVFMNSHGGQPQVLEIVARDMHVKYPDFMIFPLFVWNVPNAAAEILDPHELEFGIHAGDAETSLMLALLPDQVNMSKAVAEYPPKMPAKSMLSFEGDLPFAWSTQDFSSSGVIGDATVASAEKGERLLASLAANWAKLIAEIYIFQQPHT